MKMIKYILMFVTGFIIFTSCKDIVAEDISEKTPVLILPAVADTSMVNPVLFKWEAMAGATKYHLQVVSPNFSSISSYVLDTIVTDTEFLFALDSAEFELKLTAINGGYTSKTLGPIQFWVGLSPTINTSTIVLQSPTNGAYVNETFNGSFNWQALSGASSYEFSLRKGTSFAIGTIEHTQNNITPAPYYLPGTVALTEGTYFWGVKAYLSTGETYFSTRSFQVDVTAPSVASLLSPTNMSFINVGVTTFTWSNGSDSGTIQSPIESTIEVATDVGFSSIVHSTTLIGNTTQFTLTPGTYYWRVRNIDSAGNVSAYSTVNQITVS
jgi:hypothetical protein